MEQEINHTRERIGKTVETLEQRLSPGQLVDQALGYVREHSGEFASNIANSVRQNPVPVIVTGIGLLWLLRSQTSSRPFGRHADMSTEDEAGLYGSAGDDSGLYRGTEGSSGGGLYRAGQGSSGSGLYGGSGSSRQSGGIRDRLAGVGEAIKSRVASVRSSVSSGGGGSMTEKVRATRDSVTESVTGKAHGVVESAQSTTRSVRQWAGGGNTGGQVRRARDEFTNLMEEQPLLMGAVGLAIGVAIGALTPTTRREREMLGGAGDSLAEKASEMAAEGYENLRETASQTVNELTKSFSGKGGSGPEQKGASGQQQTASGASGSSKPATDFISEGMSKSADPGVGSVGSGSGQPSSSKDSMPGGMSKAADPGVGSPGGQRSSTGSSGGSLTGSTGGSRAGSSTGSMGGPSTGGSTGGAKGGSTTGSGTKGSSSTGSGSTDSPSTRSSF